jgi:Cation transport protein/Transposase IS200 like
VIGFIKGNSAIHLVRVYAERRRNFTGQHFWARGYFVSTVGRDEAVIRAIRAHIRHQDLKAMVSYSRKTSRSSIASSRRAPLQTILRLLGLLLTLFSVTMLPPMLVGWWYGDGAILPFAVTFILTLTVGLACWLPVRHVHTELRNRDGFMVVVVFWFVLSILGALPLVLAERPDTLVKAIFEAVSGLTTTGATILVHIDALPHAILYYRAQLNFWVVWALSCWR